MDRNVIEDDDRPTSEAFQDRENPLEIYQDLDTGYTILCGQGWSNTYLSGRRPSPYQFPYHPKRPLEACEAGTLAAIAEKINNGRIDRRA